MAASFGQIDCKLYPSAFSGELVFQVDTTVGESCEGVAPKHYVETSVPPTKDGIDGQVRVRVISNGGKEARVSMPDGQILTVSADKLHEK
jgi:hypothetical protein